MRPPQNAGEDADRSVQSHLAASGFNEAPAERGGRLEPEAFRAAARWLASMRPPQNAGEDPPRQGRPPPRRSLQ